MKVLLIDLTNLAYRYIETKDYKLFPLKLMKDVLSFSRSFNADEIVCALDYGKSEFRKKLFPEYKAGRFERLTPEQQERRLIFFENLNTMPDVLATEGIISLRYKGIEGDDLLAYIVKNFPKHDYTLISADTDLLQLEVEQFSPFKKNTDDKFISLNKIGYKSAKEYITSKSMAGDKSDNIDGVYGIGEKTALKILRKYNTEDFEDLISKLKQMGKLGKKEQGVLDSQNIIRRNIDLIDLYKHNEEIVADIKEDLEEKLKEVL